MRRIVIAICCLGLLSMTTWAAFAQDDPPGAPQDDPLATAVAEAQAAAEDAEAAAELAFNLLGIFEAISVAITVVGAALGAFGFVRLLSAESNLEQTSKQIKEETEETSRRILQETEKLFEDLDKRTKEFDALRENFQHQFDELRNSIQHQVDEQRNAAREATLASTLLSFGDRQYKATDYAGAAETFRRALDLDPNNPVIYYRLGYVLTYQGELEAALQNHRKSLEIDENFAPAMVALGFAYRRIGQKMDPGIEQSEMYNQAEQWMLKGLKVSPRLIDEEGESWWGALGGLYSRREQISQAINAYEQAKVVTPYSSYPFGNLATLYGRESRVDDMLAMYARVEKLAAAEAQATVGNYWGYFDLLTSQLALGHLKEAEDTLPSALEAVPNDAAYAFDTLIDTLRRVAGILKGREQEAGLLDFAERVSEYYNKRKVAAEAEAGTLEKATK